MEGKEEGGGASGRICWGICPLNVLHLSDKNEDNIFCSTRQEDFYFVAVVFN